MSATQQVKDPELGQAPLPSLHALQPDPLEPRPNDVERYVAALQAASAGGSADPSWLQREAWNQIRLAKERYRRHPQEAGESMSRIFRLGTAPDERLNGFCPGLLVATVGLGIANPAARMFFEAWLPWLGKGFDSTAQTGINVLKRSAGPHVRTLWRNYQFQPTVEGNLEGFRFRTYVAPGELDPDREVLKIDYESPENPKFIIRSVLDELVEVVPGAYMGKALYRLRGSHRLLMYFALRLPEVA